MAELVDQSLRSFRLLHDALLVVLPNGTRQLIVVHGRSILATSPQSGHAHRVLDLEHSLRAVQPADGRAVLLWIGQQLFEELPEMNVGATLAAGFRRWQDEGGAGSGGRRGSEGIGHRGGRCGGEQKVVGGGQSDHFGEVFVIVWWGGKINLLIFL